MPYGYDCRYIHGANKAPHWSTRKELRRLKYNGEKKNKSSCHALQPLTTITIKENLAARLISEFGDHTHSTMIPTITHFAQLKPNPINR